jgi:hypothetical protein
MKKYRSPEMIIRDMMGGGELNEQHAPALKIPEPYRVEVALQVLHDNGISTATRKDEKTVAVGNKEWDMAMQVLDNALMHGKIEAKPLVVSAEAIDVPDVVSDPVEVKAEPTPPAGGHSIGEGVNDEEELATGNIDPKTGTFQSAGRTLHNRKENQLKKIDEEEEEQIDELSYGKMAKYTEKSRRTVNSLTKARTLSTDHGASTNKLDHKIAVRKAGIKTADTKKAVHMKKIFAESTSIVEKVLNLISELSRSKLVKYADKAQDQKRDAFASGDRKTYFKRHAGVKKAVEKLGEETQIDEVSKDTLKSYISKRTGTNLHMKQFSRENDHTLTPKAKGRVDRFIKKSSEGLHRAHKKLNKEEVEQVDELSRGKLKAYARKARGDAAKHQDVVTNHDHSAFVAKVKGDDASAAHHSATAEKHFGRVAKRTAGVDKAKMRLREHIESLDEGKKEDDAAVEKAGKHFASHARADSMHGDMMKAAKHYNYVQDATDHVYSNNAKHVKYADWHAMKPHIEDHFRKHGLED